MQPKKELPSVSVLLQSTIVVGNKPYTLSYLLNHNKNTTQIISDIDKHLNVLIELAKHYEASQSNDKNSAEACEEAKGLIISLAVARYHFVLNTKGIISSLDDFTRQCNKLTAPESKAAKALSNHKGFINTSNSNDAFFAGIKTDGATFINEFRKEFGLKTNNTFYQAGPK